MLNISSSLPQHTYDTNEGERTMLNIRSSLPQHTYGTDDSPHASTPLHKSTQGEAVIPGPTPNIGEYIKTVLACINHNPHGCLKTPYPYGGPAVQRGPPYIVFCY